MDFVEGLPTSGSANAILIIVDKFSKFAHFVPLHHPFTAKSVAKLFMDHVYRLHGCPPLLSQTGIAFSPASSGRPYFAWLVFNCA